MLSRFVISEANSNTLVFDVTDALNVKRVEADLNGSELSFTIPAGRLREFVLVQTNQTFPSPEVVGEVASSNLHGLEQRDMILYRLRLWFSRRSVWRLRTVRKMA